MDITFKTHLRKMSSGPNHYAVTIPNAHYVTLPDKLPYFDKATIKNDGKEMTIRNARISRRAKSHYFCVRADDANKEGFDLDEGVTVNATY